MYNLTFASEAALIAYLSGIYQRVSSTPQIISRNTVDQIEVRGLVVYLKGKSSPDITVKYNISLATGECVITGVPNAEKWAQDVTAYLNSLTATQIPGIINPRNLEKVREDDEKSEAVARIYTRQNNNSPAEASLILIYWDGAAITHAEYIPNPVIGL